MGGSAASGGNAQLFDLISRYGGNGGGGTNTGGGSSPRRSITQQDLQSSLNNWLNGSLEGGGFRGVMGFPDMEANYRGGYGGRPGGIGGKKPPTTPPPTDPNSQFSWQFPQYTQTWAFTPPTPTPYMNPQPFDPKKYGNPFDKKGIKKNT